jgi:hypothetical protein
VAASFSDKEVVGVFVRFSLRRFTRYSEKARLTKGLVGPAIVNSPNAVPYNGFAVRIFWPRALRQIDKRVRSSQLISVPDSGG